MPFKISLSMGSKFVDDCLKVHNDYRKKHGVPALKHNKELTAIAQKWADHLARSGSFQHSTNRELKGEKLGENIAMKWTSSGDEFTGGQVTEQWYDEVKKYNFNTHHGGGTGHFTQVVWRDSRELGVAKAQAKDGKWIVVANYLPAGNFVGQHASNVYPVGGGGGSGKRGESAGVSRPGLFGSLFGKKEDNQRTPVVKGTSKAAGSYGYDGSGSSKSVSRKMTTETVNGRTVTKTVITETTVNPDGKKTVTRREEVSEGSGCVSEQPSGDLRWRFGELSVGSPSQTHSLTQPLSHSTNNNVTFTTHQPHQHPITETSSKDKKPQKLKDFIHDVVKAHNGYRKKHGKVGDLRSSSSLNELAQSWAEHLASISVLKHSDHQFKGQSLGENVAYRWASNGADYTGQEVTDQWYSELQKYDFNRNDFKSGTGHFTQVVWKGSKEVGVGKAFGFGGKVFVVCNYFPAGNVRGQFQENVCPAS